MAQSDITSAGSGMLEEIAQFIGRSSGLKSVIENNQLELLQLIDNRRLKIIGRELELILPRRDHEGKEFLQLNFTNNKKILITDHLVGFKPHQTAGLDVKKLPRVVTTPDLVSVLEALEETMSRLDQKFNEVDTLKRAYYSIVMGAETVGFSMAEEKRWLYRLVAFNFSHTA